jgi:putative cardiolipin synthase
MKLCLKIVLSGVLLIAVGCAHIPKNPDKPVSYSHRAADEGLLAESSKTVLTGYAEDQSAFMLIQRNSDALKWRLALIDSAQQSIDLQVFIWSNDESGRLILSRIMAAAERGVQVRLLVDDMPKDWSDEGTALVARIPNIQLRRFNPGRVRKGMIRRAFQMSTQFSTLNRRMHNKQMLVDGRWGIIGGRNIGNPYFGLSSKYNNRDLDLLLTGPILQNLAIDFDEYWNADVAYPGEFMSKEKTPENVAKWMGRFDDVLLNDQELLNQTTIPVNRIDWHDAFESLPARMVSGTAESMKDSPEVKGDRGIRLVEQLDQTEFRPRYQTSAITPYMIPSKELLATLERANQEGRMVRFLVPSMESNNHTMAHSHYKKYRKKLLDRGAELYEFRGQPSAALRALSDTPPVKSKFISLHTKAFTLDEHWVLLGSLNIDPRSIDINTEHMLVIDSPQLAAEMLSDYETMIAPENAWAVTRNDKGKLRWTSIEGERSSQPARSYGQRWKDFFWRLMPVKSQL